MKLNSIFAFAFIMAAAACSKTSSDSPARVIATTSTGSGSSSSTGTVDITRGDPGTGTTSTVSGDTSGSTTSSTSGQILLTQYPGVVPTTKVCRNVLDGKNVDTLKKFFGWDIVALEGPVTVCLEQNNSPSLCPTGEPKCAGGVNKNVRIRLEYEDNFRFWYYDSAAPLNYAKVLTYTGGSGAASVEFILQDGAGFLRASGNRTATGAYDVNFSYADRPSYTVARKYDTDNAYGPDSPYHRAATLYDMQQCAQSANGAAKYTDGSDCASRFVIHYTFFTDMNTAYPTTQITDTALWLQNQVTMARQLVTNQFPTQFAAYGVVGGNFGTVTANGL